MTNIKFCKELSVYRTVDVLVLGGGPAGIGAAIAAARGGAKTLVVEQYGCVGGAATMGLVGPFMTSFDSNNEQMVIRGVFKDVVDRMVSLGGAIDPKDIPGEDPKSGFYKIGHAHVGPFDHECFKQVTTSMILESGAELLLHTQFIDVLEEDGHITGVVVANKSGMQVLRAKIFIDATGDADVAARAGVPYVLGNITDGNIQPATLFFRLYNVDTERVKAHIAQHKEEILPFYGPYSWLIRDMQEEWGDVPRAEVCLFEGVVPGQFRLNVTRILDVDGTNAEDLTRAELEGMRQAYKVYAFLKKYAVGFENAQFMGTAAAIGIRETRHIEGLQKLTAPDVTACLVPDDTIAVMATCMDTHNKSDPGGTFYPLTNGPYFGVPYGCLLPKSVDNLLVAGRAISADSVAASATRMIPCCMVLGQAAGAAATLAITDQVLPMAVPTEKLRAVLKEQGAFLGE
ncbi:MAG TPA: FAD-dependent oxidoreductase [Candidatus Limiplasma sp.]|nr:FAD-dependent oxidoreductase [Candidatus Limiplasma sp.]